MYAHYLITLIDDYTRYGHVYLIFHKSKAVGCFKRYTSLVENQLERTVKVFAIKEWLSSNFEMTNMAEPAYMFGIKIKRDCPRDS